MRRHEGQVEIGVSSVSLCVRGEHEVKCEELRLGVRSKYEVIVRVTVR